MTNIDERQMKLALYESAPWPRRLLTAGVFAILTIVTVLAAQQQWHHEQYLLSRHTEDVCLQTAQRLEVFVESRLDVAEIFADRWATHEGRDYSRQRFEEFGAVLLRHLPGYRAVGLVRPESDTTWVVPSRVDLSKNRLGDEYARVLDEASSVRRPVLSAPVEFGEGGRAFFAAMKLRSSENVTGHIIVKFHSETLIDECLSQQIREEFTFQISDDDQLLYRNEQGEQAGEIHEGTIGSSRSFAVANRTWQLTMSPRELGSLATALVATLPVLLLGFLLSAGLTWLVALLIKRMNLYRRARDMAMDETVAREKAQEELSHSEARYRSVFDSVTDGLIIMDLDGNIVEANGAAFGMHCRESGTLNGTSYLQLIAPSRRHLWDELRKQLDSFEPVRYLSRHLCVGGEAFDVEVRGTTFDTGEERLIVVILTDVTERLQAQQRQAVLSRKVLVAQEEERARVARELHDELGQILTALRFEMGWLKKHALITSAEAKGAFDGSVELVETAAKELRRLCRGLRPPLLDDLGLEPAVRHLVEMFTERTGIEVELEVALDVDAESGDGPIPKELALATYRILQESLTNVGRHSAARSVAITLVRTSSGLVASVEDDGQGFDVGKLGAIEGYGMEGMKERASLVGGAVEINSAPSQGTRVVFNVPATGYDRK